MAASCGIAERVILQESTPDIFEVYSRAHLFAIPSLWEGFPNVLAEALAHGLPAVGFQDAAGVAHLIADGETGWLATGLANDDDLAGALDEAMTDGSERKRRGVLAARSVADYKPEVQFDHWANLIQSVLENRSR